MFEFSLPPSSKNPPKQLSNELKKLDEKLRTSENLLEHKVEKLSQTIQDLEESILASGAAANAIRDYERQIFELNPDDGDEVEFIPDPDDKKPEGYNDIPKEITYPDIKKAAKAAFDEAEKKKK